MNLSDKIVKEIFSAVDIIVDQRIKDTDYSRTINCQVKERIKNSDMYILLYQNEELRAISMGASYRIGDKVIVLLPDKNSLSPKFILGRVNDRTPTIVPNQNGELSPEILAEIQKALDAVNDLVSDNVISPSEKTTLSLQWLALTASYEAQLAECVLKGIDPTKLTAYYLDLKEMVDQILENMGTSTNIIGSELRDKFTAYYTEEQVVRRLIAAIIPEIVIGAENLIKNAGFLSSNTDWETSASFGVVEAVANMSIIKKALAYTSQAIDISQNIEFTTPPKEGEEYRLSFYIYRVDGPDKISATLFGETKEFIFDPTELNLWRRVVLNFTVPAAQSNNILPLRISSLPLGTTKITGVQLERGQVVTDFKYNSNDIADKVESTERDIINLKDITSPEKIIDTVVLSEEFNGVLSELPSYTDIDEIKNQVQNVESSTMDYVNTTFNGMDAKVNELEAEMIKTVNAIKAEFSLGAGVNLIRNSTGFFDTENWNVDPSGSLKSEGNEELEQKAIGAAFYTDTLMSAKQSIVVKPDTEYSFSVWIKKTKAGKAFVNIYDQDGLNPAIIVGPPEAELAPTFVAPYIVKFRTAPEQEEVVIEMFCDGFAEAYYSGLMLNEGSIALQWSSHPQEIANSNIRFNLNGIRVKGNGGSYTQMTPKEFAGYSRVLLDDGSYQTRRIFTFNGEVTEAFKIKAEKGIEIGTQNISSIVEIKSNEPFGKNGLGIFIEADI